MFFLILTMGWLVLQVDAQTTSNDGWTLIKKEKKKSNSSLSSSSSNTQKVNDGWSLKQKQQKEVKLNLYKEQKSAFFSNKWVKWGTGVLVASAATTAYLMYKNKPGSSNGPAGVPGNPGPGGTPGNGP